jgi:hypothetical protein
MRRIRIWIASFVVAACAAATPLFAQQGTAELRGRIADEQNAALPGVAIVATNEATGIFRETVTSAEGTFHLAQLVPGPYRIAARELTQFGRADIAAHAHGGRVDERRL